MAPSVAPLVKHLAVLPTYKVHKLGTALLLHGPEHYRFLHHYEKRLLDILEASLPIAGGEINTLAPRQLPLSPEAKHLYINFHNAIEKELIGAFQCIRGFANKAPEHAIRLAAVLQLIENLECESIDVGHMANGIEITKHYLSESLRLVDAGQSDTQLTLAGVY